MISQPIIRYQKLRSWRFRHVNVSTKSRSPERYARLSSNPPQREGSHRWWRGNTFDQITLRRHQKARKNEHLNCQSVESVYIYISKQFKTLDRILRLPENNSTNPSMCIEGYILFRPKSDWSACIYVTSWSVVRDIIARTIDRSRWSRGSSQIYNELHTCIHE